MTVALLPLHGIGSRDDLPLPFGFVVIGAALTLIISFGVLLFAWRRPRYSTIGGGNYHVSPQSSTTESYGWWRAF